MDYYDRIKNELINNEVYKRVKEYSKNRSDLNTYYNVGRLLIEAQGGEKRAKYGDSLIKEYSKKLKIEVGKQYDYKNLFKMRKLYLLFEKFPTLSRQLTWSHYVELLKFDDINIINYYVNISIEYNLSVRELRFKIKAKEYERLDDVTKNKLINKENTLVVDFVKNPILIKDSCRNEFVSEKILKQLILEDIDSFLKKLGNGFCYVENEYKIKLGNQYNYIDMLLFNYIYNCFIVIELKVTELKKEHIGQIQTYMNYVDRNVKTDSQDNTIGIIICKKNNKFIMGYCSCDRIFSKEYILW